ncbi:MAG: tRNA 4-thiouridine(8) synthase ThiI [Candidatus Magasanikbacteria bacterium CG10_big_fil_rev_8_21_14_0_10_36_32]|uniref:Probable tRNA sulfurtransferase n=1 Tax=Candidatus Magasanikbacteria bacterium CG10_big_fil_rev_8_21_14_0_10_36_32 TaxID=1974646 RepID=A0A2M6W7R3_9BACT|nr:MAG: tRNA 4-thiouridine(8) synthase ThiI [Candidatus Magasanikbacteria bacterium CG10_big_fil_rev_8_21_14_0_10_36_32]
MDVITHFDEIFLKGKNQLMFIRCLADNLDELFPKAAIQRVEGGFVILNLEDDDLERLSKIPGIAKLAPCQVIGNSMDEIKKCLSGMEFDKSVREFRITASRSYKKYPINSDNINRELGGLLIDKYGWKVNLTRPELNIYIDISKDKAVVYINPQEGASGLPIGSAGKVMCLVSGGIDSPVAAYQMMRRGAEVVFVHFQNQTQVTDEVSLKIIDLTKTLAQYQSSIKLFIAPFAECQRQVVMKIPADYRMIITRRLMFRIAEKLSKKENCQALITGDSLGQVASQTLENLTAIYDSVDMLKLAPLIGMNKSEIMKLARKLGTLDISNRPYEDCCSLFVAKHPQTKSKLQDVLELEKQLDLSTLDNLEIISYNISMIKQD